MACLIRRLKERLESGPESLTCVGTSAIGGAKSDPEATKELVAFASEVLGVEFAPDRVVEEDRYAAHEVLGMELEFDRVPRAEEAPELDPDRFASAEGWLEAQKRLWLGDPGPDPFGASLWPWTRN